MPTELDDLDLSILSQIGIEIQKDGEVSTLTPQTIYEITKDIKIKEEEEK